MMLRPYQPLLEYFAALMRKARSESLRPFTHLWDWAGLSTKIAGREVPFLWLPKRLDPFRKIGQFLQRNFYETKARPPMSKELRAWLIISPTTATLRILKQSMLVL